MSAKKTTLTARDTELVAMAWQCLTTEPKLDYAKFAQLAGFKNAATASACWGPVKKKLMASTDDADGDAPKKTPTSKRKKTGTVAPENETPSKKPRTEAKAKGTVDGEPDEAVGAEIDTMGLKLEDDVDFGEI